MMQPAGISDARPEFPKLPKRTPTSAALLPRRADTLPTGPLGLRGKIVLFAILLAALPLLVSSIWMISATEDELKSAVNDSLVSTTEEVMGQIRSTVEPALSTLSLLRGALDNQALDVDDKVALLHGAIEALPGLQAMRLTAGARPPVYLFKQAFKTRLDAAGVLPSEALPALKTDVAVSETLTVWEPVHLRSMDAWLLPLSVSISGPVPAEPTRLSAYLDLGDLQRALAAHPFRKSGGIWLMNGEGQPLFHRISGLLSRDLMELASKASHRGVVVTPYEEGDGTMTLTAVGKTDLPSWTVLVAVPEQQAYAILDRMQGHLALWLILGLAAAVVGALALAYRIGQPIREMAAVTEQVGHGNFGVRVREEGRRDEIGALGGRLNDMIAGLGESHRRLEHLARQDTLTGLPNRLAVLDHLRRTVDESTRGGGRIALLFLDLDRFKKVNDSLGHAVGDQLLKLAAERLRDCLSDLAMAARLGGDEFLVVLEQVPDREMVSAVANRVIEAFSTPFHLMDYELYVGVTIGISMAPEDGSDVGELIDNSDMAMYQAKEQGRGHFRFFGHELKTNAVRHLTLDSQLRQALERDELAVFYQPIVDAESGHVSSMEALVRWPNNNGGFVASPEEFVQLAEETGLVVPLGEWVMDTACRQTQAWHRTGLPKVTVAVNVSAQQFSRQNFNARVRQSMDSSGLDPQCIKLEVTERLLMDDIGHAIKQIRSLKEMGIQFSIDDFGTGYSSLAYLRRFPLDYLKVAQEFVRGMGVNPNDAMIAGAVIALGKSLGLKVIAEGVETRNELDFLRRRDCDLIQGYFFSRALPSSEFEDLLMQGGRFGVPPIQVRDG